MTIKSFPGPDLGYIPPPPPLPKYDPMQEAPMWDRKRVKVNLPVDKGPKPWTPVGTQPKSSDEPDWRGVVRDNVIPYPEVEPYKFGPPMDPKYFWFDTPDYADPFKKLGSSFKIFVQTGIMGFAAKGWLDGLRFTTQNNIILMKKVFVPWVLGGMAASTAVICVANLRGNKDDIYNYLPAGLLLGAILGRKDHRSYVRWTAVTVPAAMYVKYNAEINGKIWPKADLFRQVSWFLNGCPADKGVKSGDFRFGYTTNYGDPGRDLRKVW